MDFYTLFSLCFFTAGFFYQSYVLFAFLTAGRFVPALPVIWEGGSAGKSQSVLAEGEASTQHPCCGWALGGAVFPLRRGGGGNCSDRLQCYLKDLREGKTWSFWVDFDFERTSVQGPWGYLTVRLTLPRAQNLISAPQGPSAPAPAMPQQGQSPAPHNPAWPRGPRAGPTHGPICWPIRIPSPGTFPMPRAGSAPSAPRCPAPGQGGGTGPGCWPPLGQTRGSPHSSQPPGSRWPMTSWPGPPFWHWWISHHECKWVGKFSWPKCRSETSTAIASSTNLVILLLKVNQVGQVLLTLGKSMLTVPNHFPLFHLFKSGFQEDLLHDFSRDWREADEPIVPWVTLLKDPKEESPKAHSFFEDGYKVCFFSSHQDVSWSPWPFKDNRGGPHYGTGQLPQHPQMKTDMDWVLTINPWLRLHPLLVFPFLLEACL